MSPEKRRASSWEQNTRKQKAKKWGRLVEQRRRAETPLWMRGRTMRLVQHVQEVAHQGTSEKARRVRQMAAGWVLP